MLLDDAGETADGLEDESASDNYGLSEDVETEEIVTIIRDSVVVSPPTHLMQSLRAACMASLPACACLPANNKYFQSCSSQCLANSYNCGRFFAQSCHLLQPGDPVNLCPPPEHIIEPRTLAGIQERAEIVALNLGLSGFATLDGFVNADTGNLTVLEVNSLPALDPGSILFSQARLTAALIPKRSLLGSPSCSAMAAPDPA